MLHHSLHRGCQGLNESITGTGNIRGLMPFLALFVTITRDFTNLAY